MRAFLVLGPESSGTRLVTSLLIAGGCHGDSGHQQPFDVWHFGGKDPIVWRRSFPMYAYHLWPSIDLDLLKPLRQHGYSEVGIVVTARDWHSLWQSQIARGCAPGEPDAFLNISLAYREIFSQLQKLPFLVVTYEALAFFGERAGRVLLKKLGLDHQAELPPIYNELEKYYK